MILLKNIREVLTLDGSAKKKGRSLSPSDVSILQECSIVFDDQLMFVGDFKEITSDLLKRVSRE